MHERYCLRCCATAAISGSGSVLQSPAATQALLHSLLRPRRCQRLQTCAARCSAFGAPHSTNLAHWRPATRTTLSLSAGASLLHFRWGPRRTWPYRCCNCIRSIEDSGEQGLTQMYSRIHTSVATISVGDSGERGHIGVATVPAQWRTAENRAEGVKHNASGCIYI